MKSFRDRNPYAVGIVSMLIIGVITLVTESPIRYAAWITSGSHQGLTWSTS